VGTIDNTGYAYRVVPPKQSSQSVEEERELKEELKRDDGFEPHGRRSHKIIFEGGAVPSQHVS